MHHKILITEEIHESGKHYLLNQGYEIVMGSGISEDTVCREIVGCSAVLTRNAIITEKVICSAPKLKVIAVHGVGVDIINVEAATKRGIYVVNAAGSNSLSVAEYTIGLILGLARNIPLCDRELRNGNSGIRKTIGFDLEGKTLGIIGMGNIGSQVAQKASRGFGMRVIGYKRRVASHIQDGVEWSANLEHVIRESDILSLHVPYTADTKKLIGGRELAMMKPGAFLINTSRGEVLDSEALIDSLRNRHLAGAALDVFEGAFPGRDHPLMQFPNVIVTPHTAAFTSESLKRMALYAAVGIDEVLSGKEPERAVNAPEPVDGNEDSLKHAG
jgi:D-3-phosphoglycerate dehydrogenase / 2-oxoglutarate reductase